MYVDDLDYNATDVSAWVQSFDDVSGNATNRGRIRVHKASDLGVWHSLKVSAAVTDASGYTKITFVYIDGAGSLAADDKVFLSFTASGEDGAIPGYYYKFDTSTSDADPGAGDLRFNHATYASATAIYIDDVDQNSVNTVTDVLTWDDSSSTIKGYLHIVDINDATTYARFSITGSSTDGSGYNKLAVTHIASNNTFSAADELSVHFTRQGDKGDTGSTGSTAGTAGLGMTWDDSTADADNGAGKIAWNHATIASATVLYVDDADDASADISGFVQSWDDVTNTTAKGYVQITKEGATGTYAVFKVNGSVTDASGYTKVPVAHVVSAGSFTDADGVGVQFVQSGADGSGSLSNVVEDTTPQLGGDLDLNGQDIVSTSNADIDIIPNGTGDVNLGADTVQVGDNNANATITTQGTGDLILNTNNGSSSGNITLLDGANGNIEFTNNGTGVVKFNDAAYYPEANLAFDATQDWDVQASPVAKVTLTDNVTFDAPSNPTTGQFISILCIQDNTGSRTIAWDGVFEFASDEAPTATTTADKGDLFSFRYNGTKWLCVGTTLALTLS
jgi:hypothetical protein